MPTHHPLFHEVFERISTTIPQVRKTGRTRLTLLVVGILLAKSCVEYQVADELRRRELTRAQSWESVARRLRRILGDPRLDPATCYAPALAAILDWDSLLAASKRVVLITDESTQGAHVHLLRISLAYRGGSLPLVWAIWAQNTPLPEGHYWQTMDQLLEQVAALLPAGIEVVVLADRAYDVPPMLDRLSARGWHWVIRYKAHSATRFQRADGTELAMKDLLQRRLSKRGRRCKLRGKLFKDAGWREVSVVALWAEGYDHALVVLTDFPPHWDALPVYRKRFWIELGFRTDKRAGWQWESCQVRELAHQRVLLLAMAWATLITLCLGTEQAEADLAEREARPPRRPEHARFSLFTLGLKRLADLRVDPKRWHMRWRLPALDAPSWNHQWLSLQRRQLLAQTVRP
jgi:hypothetical protein